MSKKTGSLWFYSKDEANNFNNNIASTNNFKFFKYKTKLLGNTVAQLASNAVNGILRNATVVVTLKYLSNFWRSIKILLSTCKVELKCKWIKYCVFSAGGKENDINEDANANNIIFTIKYTKFHVLVVTLSARDNQNLSELLRKVFEKSAFWNQYKTRSENKNVTNEFRYFLESGFAGANRLFVLVYTNERNNSERFNGQKYYLPKGIIRNYNVIIPGKNFYDQAIDSDIEPKEEIRKLTTGQGGDYTNGCLLDYDYIKNHYRLIAVDLSRKKELDADPKEIQQMKFN